MTRSTLGFITFSVRRLLYAGLVLLAVIYMTFFGLGVSRGKDLGTTAWLAAGDTADYLGRLARWDLGRTYLANTGGRTAPVTERLPEVLPRTLILLGVSLLIAAVVGVLLGMVAARRRSGWLYPWVLLLSLLGVSLPSFFIALLLQIGVIRLGQQLGRVVLPVGGFGVDAHLVLPALVLAARPLAQVARVTSIAVSSTMGMEHVRVARGKGLRDWAVWWRHVVRVSAIPVLTTLGTSVRYAMVSLPVVEFFFSWDGVGSTLLKTLARQDDLMTVALTLTLGGMVVAVNVLLDYGYRLLDPRLRDAAREPGRKVSMGSSLLDGLQELWEAVADHWLLRRLLGRPADELPVLSELAQQQVGANGLLLDGGRYRRERVRAWVRGTLSNGPFLIGALVLVALLVAFVAGPGLTPHNPYVTRGVSYVDGQLLVPPFAPDAEFLLGTDMLGRDILSLLLAGSQQTLVLAAAAMVARMGLGFMLGALAGWNEGSLLDRAIVSLSEMVAALPALLFAMLLILAIGIREGAWVFVVALCFVGWGEVMQYVRAEVMAIRPQVYIESAVATGSRIGGIILRHALPNLLPALIAMAALEMGAVLMMLGELGFLSVFIGGGAYTELSIAAAAPFHYSDVPEWGALLANLRTYARSYPWTAIYPALAFFVAIVGFNLFGEGVRRLVQEVGIGLNRLVNRWTVGAAVLLALVLIWMRTNTGAMAFYRQQAEAFDGESALAYTAALADPQFEYRQLGTAGHRAAADWVAEQFEALGLQPAGSRNSYFQTVRREYFRITETPTLEVDGRAYSYGEEFVAAPVLELNAGAGSGEILVVLAGELESRYNLGGYRPPPPPENVLAAVDGSQVALLLSDGQLDIWDDYPFQAALVVTDDPQQMGRFFTASAYTGWRGTGSWGVRVGGGDLALPLAPILYITREVAEEILAQAGLSLTALEREERGLGINEVTFVRTGRLASASIVGEVPDKVETVNVMGYLPGVEIGAAGGQGLDAQMIMVTTQYDGPGVDFDGQVHPAVVDNASGVGVMLELLRSWQATGYQPKRTFMFVAYANEGLEYGKSPRREPEAVEFLTAKPGFSNAYNLEAILNLRGLGGGWGDGLMVSTGGSLHLVEIFAQAARLAGAGLERQDLPLDYRAVWLGERGGFFLPDADEAPNVSIWWDGFHELAGTPADTLELVRAEKLELAGRTISQALLMMGREITY